ncbi:hypothetical protein TNCV_2221601 [Trichonephila clavipes]|nr:hypothetical protein TNCV_2221601 [Trichonephila clavipes]
MSAGRRSWFGVDLVRSSLRTRPRSKSVDFHNAKNQQIHVVCSMLKIPVVPIWLGCSWQDQISSPLSHRQRSDASLL